MTAKAFGLDKRYPAPILVTIVLLAGQLTFGFLESWSRTLLAITTAIGMYQLPPVVISTPLKILLFVMVDGWHLLASSLLKSF